MGKFFNKIRQVFNIFLLSALIALAASVFVYFLTTPEQRGVTFWISVVFMVIGLVLETLQASGIAMRTNSGRNIPVSFSKFILGAVYFLFTIIMAFWNAFSSFTETKFLLIEIAGLVVFLVPMVLINMAELRLTGSDRKQQDEGRQELASMASRVGYIADDLKASGIPAESLRQIANFSEALRYSDPTPASGKLERALKDAINNLEEAASNGDIQAVIKACTLADRALRERNDYVKNAK